MLLIYCPFETIKEIMETSACICYSSAALPSEKWPSNDCGDPGNCRSRMERISGPFKKWFWQTVKGTFNGRRPTL